MQVRRHLQRFFGSFRRSSGNSFSRKSNSNKAKVIPGGNETATFPTTAIPTAGSSSRLKKGMKEQSLSRCQLLDSYDDDDSQLCYYCDDQVLDSLNPENNQRFPYEKPSNEKIQLPGTIEFHVEFCQEGSLLSPSSSSPMLARSPSHGVTSHPADLCELENPSGLNIEVEILYEMVGTEKRSRSSTDFQNGELTDIYQISSPNNQDDTSKSTTCGMMENNGSDDLQTKNKSVVSTTMTKFPGLRLTIMEWRKSVKRFRKAVKTGFVDWAESMSYYSPTVIPELYECQSTAVSDYREPGWESAKYGNHRHYSMEQRCYQQALHYGHINQISQLSY